MKLCNRFEKSTSIFSLNVSGNNFSSQQDKILSLEKFIATNKTCTSLNMSKCKLENPCLAFIGNGFLKNTTLCKLNLSENYFTKKGINLLCRGIQKNVCKLKELDLSSCRLDTEAIEPIIKLIQSGYKLRNLNLKSNFIKDPVAVEFIGALTANTNMTKLNLEMNAIKLKFTKEIDAVIK